MATAYYAKVTCSPPLGQLSVLPPETKEIYFVVLIEWNEHGGKDLPWEAAMCHRDSATEPSKAENWSTVPLKHAESSLQVVDQTSSETSSEFRALLSGTLPVDSMKSRGTGVSHECFTVKYRISKYAPWHWMKQEFEVQDGELILQSQVAESPALNTYIKLQSGWESKKQASAPGSAAFAIKSSGQVPGRTAHTDSTFQDLALGQIQGLTRWFAVTRYQEMWLGPRQGKKDFFLTDPALTISFLTETGHHLTLVALNGIGSLQTHMTSHDGDTVVLSARNDGDEDEPYQVLAAVSLDLETSISAAMEAAQNIITKSEEMKKTGARISPHKPPDNLLESRPLNDWYDGLGFCTYNALGLDLSTEKLLGALDELAAHGIRPPTLIIDDNWQTIEAESASGWGRLQQGMKRFEANSTFFPEGLKAAVTTVRTKHPHIDDIAVWHALMGYWAGIDPNSEFAHQYKTADVKAMLVGHTPGSMTIIAPEDIGRWYNDFYAFLSSCGVTGVKTDVQCQLDLLAESPARASYSQAYQSAWTAAHLRHFGGRAISCMSMIPQILFGQFQTTQTPKILLRNSDDFYPEIPSSHSLHVFVNAHNALFTQNLNAIPDWDMFQTLQEYGSYHAAARCLSGGPIYITDTPGQHDIELIHQMTGPSPDGRTLAIRPDTLGRTIWPYESFAEGKLLKIGTSHGGTGLLGLFNTTMTEVRSLLSPRDIPNVRNKGNFIVRSHVTGLLFGPVDGNVSGPEKLIHIKLPGKGFDILTASPIHTVGPTKLAILGLSGKMTGAAAVVSSDVKSKGNAAIATLALKVLGELMVWVNGAKDLRVSAKVEDSEVVPQVEDVAGLEGKLIKIDTLRVFQVKQPGGDGNETTIKVEIVVS